MGRFLIVELLGKKTRDRDGYIKDFYRMNINRIKIKMEYYRIE